MLLPVLVASAFTVITICWQRLTESKMTSQTSPSLESMSVPMGASCVVRGSAQEESLIEQLTPVLKPLGYALRDLKVIGSGAPVLRVTLERLNSSENIGIDDCQKAHETLGPILDVMDPFPHAYTLEVSSPGEKPTLRTLTHFQEAIGENLKLETTEALPMPPPSKPRRKWEGELTAVDASERTLKLKDSLGEHSLPFEKIKSAVWLRDWSTAKKTPTQTRQPSNKGEK